MKKRVDVSNIITGRNFSACFYNEDGQTDVQVQTRLDTWVAEMEEEASNGKGWGWAAREIPKTEMEDIYLPILLEEYSKTVDGEVQVWCRLDKEYTITITDLTTEYENDIAQDEADAVTLSQIKQALSIVDSWTQLSDININFLKKFFKYLIRKSI